MLCSSPWSILELPDRRAEKPPAQMRVQLMWMGCTVKTYVRWILKVKPPLSSRIPKRSIVLRFLIYTWLFQSAKEKECIKIEESKCYQNLILFIKIKICFLPIHIHKHLLIFHKTEFKLARTWQRKTAIYRENRKHVPKSYRNARTHVIWFQILSFN